MIFPEWFVFGEEAWVGNVWRNTQQVNFLTCWSALGRAQARWTTKH